MSTNGDLKSYSSIGPLVKTSSETPSGNLLRQTSKKNKNAKSALSVQPSEISPQKETSFHSEGASIEKMLQKDFEIPRQCQCGPDLYSRVLGPTADESILTGLQTVIDLCSKLRVCRDRDESEEEEPSREQDIPERDISRYSSTRLKTSKSQTDRNTISAAFQVNPNVKSAAAQTLPFPEMISEILQTAGLTPEMVSKLMQTSAVEQPKKSLASILMQTSKPDIKSDAIQTSRPDVRYIQTSQPDLRLNGAQTSSTLLPVISREPSQNQETSTGDEHKCISPPEPPGSKCRCCNCSSSSSLHKDSKSSNGKPLCKCGQKQSHCICENNSKKKRSSRSKEDNRPEFEHPSPIEVKYAVTKISRYKDFTTFEVMKSTKNQPRQIPKGIEGVFVLKKKNGGSAGDVKSSHNKISENGSRKEINVEDKTSSRTKNSSIKNSNGVNNGHEEIKSQNKLEAY